MDSKELLQAKEKANKQLALIEDIEKAERTLERAKNAVVCFYSVATGNVFIEKVADPEKLEVIKDMALTAIMNYRDDRVKELKQLLGIQQVPVIPKLASEATIPGKPAIVNPDFDKAVNEMIASVKKSATLPEEIKSLDKYPAKRDGRKKYPENMTENVVRKMYVDEGKSKKEIADYFGVKESTVNNYLYLRGISRRKNKKDKPAEPEEKERP